MIDGKPNYTRLSTAAMADVILMDPDEQIKFFHALCEMFENIMNPDYKPLEQPGFVGRAIQRQFVEFHEGIVNYMNTAKRNLSGLQKNPVCTPAGTPVGTPVCTPVGTPMGYPKRKEIEERKEKIKEEKEKDIIASTRGGGKTHTKKFIPPTVEEVRAYCTERNNGINPEHFVDYYERSDWIMNNGQHMKNWKAAIRTWEQNQKKGGGNDGGYSVNNGSTKKTDYSFLCDESRSV